MAPFLERDVPSRDTPGLAILRDLKIQFAEVGRGWKGVESGCETGEDATELMVSYGGGKGKGNRWRVAQPGERKGGGAAFLGSRRVGDVLHVGGRRFFLFFFLSFSPFGTGGSIFPLFFTLSSHLVRDISHVLALGLFSTFFFFFDSMASSPSMPCSPSSFASRDEGGDTPIFQLAQSLSHPLDGIPPSQGRRVGDWARGPERTRLQLFLPHDDTVVLLLQQGSSGGIRCFSPCVV